MNLSCPRLTRAVQAAGLVVAFTIAAQAEAKEVANANAETPVAEEAKAAPGKPSPLEPIREAQRRFNLGVTLYGEGDLRGALAEFRRAHHIFPSYKVLYNLGTVARELKDWAAALSYYRDYLIEGGDAIPAERRVLIERQVLELAQRVSRLEVVVNGGPADLTLDDQPIVSREGGLLVNPGRRRLKASYPGRPPVVRIVEMASGDRARVVVDRPTSVLKSKSGGPAAAPPLAEPVVLAAAAPPRERKESRTSARWSWVGTGLLGGGALTLGVLARQSSQVLATERTRYPAQPGTLNDMAGRTKKTALAADLLGAGALVMAAVSLYLSFSSPSSGSNADPLALAWSF